MTEEYKLLLKDLYMVTRIPVALVCDREHFETLYPKIINPPNIGEHSPRLWKYIEDHNLKCQVPLIRRIENSVYFGLIKIDDHTLVQIGPAISTHFEFAEYVRYMKAKYSDEFLNYHMKLIKGTPRVNTEYFSDIMILACRLLCSKNVTSKDMIMDLGDDRNYVKVPDNFSFEQLSVMEFDRLSFSNRLFEYVSEGNLRALDLLQEKYKKGASPYYIENNTSHLATAFIAYAAIAGRTAVLSGVYEKTIQQYFKQYMEEMADFTEPEQYWKHLPRFVRQMCILVSEVKNINQSSDVFAISEKYIRKNIYSKITSKHLEIETGVTRRTILRHFMEATGMSPSEYITNEKLKEAAILLIDTELSLAEISTTLGYSSQRHFSRVFEKKYGCSPNQYKANNKHA